MRFQIEAVAFVRSPRVELTDDEWGRVASVIERVTGLDAVDGTPVVDLKPVMREFLPREEVAQPEWASELMREYWEK